METYVVLVDKAGTTVWYKDDSCSQRHRIGGPAVEYANGNQRWLEDGKLHRIGGPAVVYGKNRYWFERGVSHRLDGPSYEYASGDKEWHINGEPLTEARYNARIAKMNAAKEQPACVDKTIAIDGVNYKLTPL